MKTIDKYLNENEIDYKKNSEIKPFLTIRVGGKVSYIITVYSYDKLKALLQYLNNAGEKFILLGGGSNIVFPDNSNNIIVIINKTSGISIQTKNVIKVDSGITNKALLKFCSQNGIGGLEFLSGIPGTIGGATAVNAGAFGDSISDFLLKAEIFTNSGNVVLCERKYFQFKYRNSIFKYGNEVILNIYLMFNNAENKDIKDKADEILKSRIERHPSYSSFTSGCFFKNPVIKGKKISAGKLIENSNLKGYKMKNISISEKHSNFIINNGNASFKEIKDIEKKIMGKIYENNGITMEREVIFISPEGNKY